MSHVTRLNNTHEEFYKFLHNWLEKIIFNLFEAKLCPWEISEDCLRNNHKCMQLNEIMERFHG